MGRVGWMMLGAALSGTVTYFILRKLQDDQGEREIKIPTEISYRRRKRRFDDLNSIFDDVDADLEEPWL
ncbi:MAG: hypothetical protein V3U69_02090 [Bacteroidota bacterium]